MRVPMRKSVIGIFTVAALAASVAIDVAAAQKRDDGSRGGGAATSGGAAATQATPPSGGGPGKLPSAGQIPAPTSAASKRVDTVAATGMGKPPSPTGERPAATRSSAATSSQAMVRSGPTTARYRGDYRYSRNGGRYYDGGWGWGGFGTGFAGWAGPTPHWGGFYRSRPEAYRFVSSPTCSA